MWIEKENDWYYVFYDLLNRVEYRYLESVGGQKKDSNYRKNWFYWKKKP